MCQQDPMFLKQIVSKDFNESDETLLEEEERRIVMSQLKIWQHCYLQEYGKYKIY